MKKVIEEKNSTCVRESLTARHTQEDFILLPPEKEHGKTNPLQPSQRL